MDQVAVRYVVNVTQIIGVNSTDPFAGVDVVPTPVLVATPDNAFAIFVAAFVAYALFFRVAEYVAPSWFPHLFPEGTTHTTKYEVLYRFTRCVFWSMAALCVLPSVGAMVDHALNNNIEMTLPSPLHLSLIQVTVSFSAIPIFYDLCGRRDMHWTALVHHVATCLCTIVNVEWGIGTSIVIYHCMTCYFVLPLDVALGLCAMKAPPATCARWLTITKYTGSTVYVLAQIGILPSLWKTYKHYTQEQSSMFIQLGFVLAFLLDLTLVATQVHLVTVLHGMAMRRRQQAVKKQQ